VINMFRYAGAVFVVTVGSVLYGDPTTAGATVEGFDDANVLMAASMFLAGVASAILLRNRRAPAG
jgi:hypothetical protein